MAADVTALLSLLLSLCAKSETAPRQPNTAFQLADPTLPARSFVGGN